MPGRATHPGRRARSAAVRRMQYACCTPLACPSPRSSSSSPATTPGPAARPSSRAPRPSPTRPGGQRRLDRRHGRVPRAAPACCGATSPSTAARERRWRLASGACSRVPDARGCARPISFVTIDGDGQHDPSDIPRLIACARAPAPTSWSGCGTRAPCPCKNSIGAHYLAAALPDRHQHVRRRHPVRLPAALSRRLVAELIDRVTWNGYESESEVLWRTLALGRTSRRSPSRRSISTATSSRSSTRGATPCALPRCSRRSCAGRWDGDAGLRRVRAARGDHHVVAGHGEYHLAAGRSRRPGAWPARLHPARAAAGRARRGRWCALAFAGHLAATTCCSWRWRRPGCTPSRPRPARSWWAICSPLPWSITCCSPA